jgi:hypothetical protein
MAVAVSLGQKRTGGYTVTITGTRVQEGKLVVDYHETKPPPDAIVTHALTAPWAIAIVPRSDLPITSRGAEKPNQPLREK